MILLSPASADVRLPHAVVLRKQIQLDLNRRSRRRPEKKSAGLHDSTYGTTSASSRHS